MSTIVLSQSTTITRRRSHATSREDFEEHIYQIASGYGTAGSSVSTCSTCQRTPTIVSRAESSTVSSPASSTFSQCRASYPMTSRNALASRKSSQCLEHSSHKKEEYYGIERPRDRVLLLGEKALTLMGYICTVSAPESQRRAAVFTARILNRGPRRRESAT